MTPKTEIEAQLALEALDRGDLIAAHTSLATARGAAAEWKPVFRDAYVSAAHTSSAGVLLRAQQHLTNGDTAASRAALLELVGVRR